VKSQKGLVTFAHREKVLPGLRSLQLHAQQHRLAKASSSLENPGMYQAHSFLKPRLKKKKKKKNPESHAFAAVIRTCNISRFPPLKACLLLVQAMEAQF
jgi:hypothetical protein